MCIYLDSNIHFMHYSVQYFLDYRRITITIPLNIYNNAKLKVNVHDINFVEKRYNFYNVTSY